MTDTNNEMSTCLYRDEKASAFCALLNGARETESFLFFTDPHVIMGDAEWCEAEKHLGRVRAYFAATPTDFVLSGGDWLGDSDTMALAKTKLGWVDGYMRSAFPGAYYPILGNHDTNYQGVDENGVQLGVDRCLTPEEARNLQFRQYSHPYYDFHGTNTHFYVLETQHDWNATSMSDYKWAQLDWLAGSLAADKAGHIAVAQHMWWWYGNEAMSALFTANVAAVIAAFNNKDTIELNGKTYDFSAAPGHIEFVISGHSHEDKHMRVGNCPVVATTLLWEGFDLVYVDYDRRLMHMIRVGKGEDRVFSLATGERLS